MSIVLLFVSSENTSESERRFDKGLSIFQLKGKLETITGIPHQYQQLTLYQGDKPVASLEGNEDALLGAFPVENYMRLHVGNTNPHKIKGQYTDLSQVKKYEMPEEEYVKRTDSVLAFKQRNKLGRFSDAASSASMEDEEAFKDEAANIQVGSRCEVMVGEGHLKRRGTVRFVGQTKFKPGFWVGVEYDEPLGKNDGSVDGEQYFECRPKHGAFVRPNKVTVGDFPELDLFDEEDELEEL
ncbi:uncharacterized protein VTP21DRAFT_6113 [Calcarisporiella thermophila]|uniref:uncharacterized protein n=1 Tax=Calcarisporiella thermophila TaxID=911321 RepID=UPI0037442DC7